MTAFIQIGVGAIGGVVATLVAQRFTKKAREERAAAAAKAKDEREKREAEEYCRREIERAKEREHLEKLSPEAQRVHLEQKAIAERERVVRIAIEERKGRIARGIAAALVVVGRVKGVWQLVLAAKVIADAIVEAFSALTESIKRRNVSEPAQPVVLPAAA